MSDERTAAISGLHPEPAVTYGEYSMALARFVQNNYISSGRHSRGVKPQLLRVLYATDMPGVLTEIGFMTNPQEMAYMKSEKGQNEIARNIYQPCATIRTMCSRSASRKAGPCLRSLPSRPKIRPGKSPVRLPLRPRKRPRIRPVPSRPGRLPEKSRLRRRDRERRLRPRSSRCVMPCR